MAMMAPGQREGATPPLREKFEGWERPALCRAEGLSSRKGMNCAFPPKSQVSISELRSKEILKLPSTTSPLVDRQARLRDQ